MIHADVFSMNKPQIPIRYVVLDLLDRESQVARRDIEAAQFEVVDAFDANDRSNAINIGIAEARRSGKIPGAKSGNKNRFGKYKEYSRQELDILKNLVDGGMSYRQIVKIVGFKISIGKISYLMKAMGANQG